MLKISSDWAGLEIASRCAVVIRVISVPFVEELTSSIDEGSAGLPDELIPTPCAQLKEGAQNEIAIDTIVK